MPKKKPNKEYEDQPDQVEEKVEQPTKEEPQVGVELVKACVNCRFINHGYQGPTCINPKSPHPQQRVREDDVCPEHEFQS